MNGSDEVNGNSTANTNPLQNSQRLWGKAAWVMQMWTVQAGRRRALTGMRTHFTLRAAAAAAELLTRAPTPITSAKTPGHAAASASQVPARITRSTADWALSGISHSAVCRLATLNQAVLCQHLVKEIKKKPLY